MRWYRAYVGTTTDKKLGAMALRASVSRSVVVAAWHVILESAADANAGGKCQCDEFDVSAALGEPLEAVQRILVCFAEADIFRDGQVKNWKRRQYESDLSTERVREHRERQRNVSETPPDTDSKTDTERKKADARDFEEFWKVYPKRKGSNRKSPAEKAFNSAVKSGTDPATIISAARKFAAGEATNVGTPFIPMAATWLNQRGWEEHLPDPGEEARKLAMFRGAPNSPQFLAWKAHWQDTGKQVLVRLLDQRELEGRACDFLIQRPPGHKEAA